jgi:hypothetical protein
MCSRSDLLPDAIGPTFEQARRDLAAAGNRDDLTMTPDAANAAKRPSTLRGAVSGQKLAAGVSGMPTFGR